jgi:hypothetical protein
METRTYLPFSFFKGYEGERGESTKESRFQLVKGFNSLLKSLLMFPID